MKRTFEHPTGQPSPDILEGGKRSEGMATVEDLSGGEMLKSFLEFRKLADDDASGFTSDVNPITGVLTIKDKEGKVVFLHEAGIRLEASYQDLLKEEQEIAQQKTAPADRSDEMGN